MLLQEKEQTNKERANMEKEIYGWRQKKKERINEDKV